LGAISRLIIFMVVVLPQPDGPSRTQTSPAGTSMLTLSTAVIDPKTLLTPSSLIIASVPKPGRGQNALQSEQRKIRGNGEHAYCERAGQKLADVGLGNAPGNEGAKPAGADIGRDGADRDAKHHGIA